MSRTMQDAEQIVSGYLAELLTPAPIAPSPAELKVVSIESWRDNYVPRRGADPRYLLCSAGGVKLAVPMIDVTHMLPMPPLTPPNTTNPICMGRWRHPSGEARVADLGAILSPDMAGASASTLVILGNRAWALGCVVDDETVELHADAVQWRHGATSRPWLVGMSRDPKCGVVDTAALIAWLEQELEP